MSLISHGSLITGETEQACAERWRAIFGVDRSYALARVMRATHPSPALRVYYRSVASILGEFTGPVVRMTRLRLLKSSHERSVRKPSRTRGRRSA